MSNTINLRLKVWRQEGAGDKGRFEVHEAKGIPTDASFLEMLDIVNEKIALSGRGPTASDLTNAVGRAIYNIIHVRPTGLAFGPLVGLFF